MTYLKRTLLSALASSLTVSAQVTEKTPGWFPFPMPGLEAPAGAPVDMSWLNAEPAGRHGFVQVVDGHFADGAGRRLRLFGTNITSAGLFLPDEDAASVARRLRQLGFNVLRLHMFDRTAPGNIWQDADKGIIDPEGLRRLDFLIAECAKNGIYVNVNLHAARPYPGLPEHVRRARGFDRGQTFDRWYPPYIRMLEDYATQLFNHVNPYLGKRYADEPAIAVVEINNENTLIKECRAEYRKLPEPFKSAFLSLWKQWIERKYGTTAALAAAWNRDVIPLGDERFQPDGWVIEKAPGADGRLALKDGVWRLEGTQTRATSWSWQFKHKGLHFEPRRYTLSFEARSPQRLWISPTARLDAPPWISLGLSQKVDLTPKWQHVIITGPVAECPHPGPHRISMVVESRLGVVEFRNLSLRPGGGIGLPDGQSLETGVTIPPNNAMAGVMTDYYAFLIDTEIDTAKQIRRHLRQKLGCRMPIIDTQVTYGGAGGLLREGTLSDYIDIHGYWNYPKPVRDKTKNIGFVTRNATQVSDPQGGTLTSLARHRVAGMPFSVSEYNTSYPSDYIAETFPLPGLFASLQDWDAFYQYSYRSFTYDYAPKVIWQAQQIVGRSATLVHAPAAALMFRTGLVAPWSEVLSVELPKPMVPALTAAPTKPTHLWKSVAMKREAAWFRRVELALTEQGEGITWRGDDIAPTGVRESRDGRVRWCPEDPKGPWLALDASKAKLLVGHVGGRRFDIGDVAVTVDARPWPDDGPAYACVSLVALDDKPLDVSTRMLLAASARTENQNMRWNDARTSVLKMGGEEATAAAKALSHPGDLVYDNRDIIHDQPHIPGADYHPLSIPLLVRTRP